MKKISDFVLAALAGMSVALGGAWSAKTVVALIVITLSNSVGGLAIPFCRSLKDKV